FLNKIDVVVLPSTWLKNKLKLKNSVVIRQGINIEKHNQIDVKRRNNKLNIRYFGHPTPDKGFLEVIGSFSKLDSSIYSKIIFSTNINPKIITYIEKKDNKIKVHGLITDIVEEYNKSDIVILPYRHPIGAIATPLVLLEAMACERAVITSDLPHLREICGNSVFYVKPYSVKDIVKAIEYLAERPKLRAKLGKKARMRIVNYYNQEKMFKEYENLYKKIISSSR
ncbi:glycosyltransferase, partial [Candidatus Woesearchaeota archaeon]|nr:glycosyltransferase [Candidatus Woesearchaeota archaeon]